MLSKYLQWNNNNERLSIENRSLSVLARKLYVVFDSLGKNVELTFYAVAQTGVPSSDCRQPRPIITITGEKNAQLICITDENSILETDDESSKLEDKDSGTEKHIQLKPVSSTETQTVVTSNKRDKSTQKASHAHSLKMKRLPKSSKCLQKLPKDYAVSIIQYKLDFHKHCKQNPMYRKTSNVQPWILMSKISNQILDSALLGVASEIELNDIVQQVYDSEMQS